MDTNAPASVNGYNSGNRVIDIGMIPTVSEGRSRDHKVIIEGAQLTWVLGIWNGEGMGRIEEGEVSLRVT